MGSTDIRTIFLLIFLISAFLTLMSLAYWTAQKTYNGFTLWAVSLLFQSPYLLNHDFDFFINMSRGQPLVMAICFLFLTGCWAMMAAGFTAGGIALTELYSCGTDAMVKRLETGRIIVSELAS